MKVSDDIQRAYVLNPADGGDDVPFDASEPLLQVIDGDARQVDPIEIAFNGNVFG